MKALHSTTQVDIVECREHRYESGLIEIGFYTPAILPTAQPILRCVIDRMPGNKKWFLHGKRDRENWSTVKRRIVSIAVDTARKAHEESLPCIR
jgi:hypothetical protein